MKFRAPLLAFLAATCLVTPAAAAITTTSMTSSGSVNSGSAQTTLEVDYAATTTSVGDYIIIVMATSAGNLSLCTTATSPCTGTADQDSAGNTCTESTQVSTFGTPGSLTIPHERVAICPITHATGTGDKIFVISSSSGRLSANAFKALNLKASTPLLATGTTATTASATASGNISISADPSTSANTCANGCLLVAIGYYVNSSSTFTEDTGHGWANLTINTNAGNNTMRVATQVVTGSASTVTYNPTLSGSVNWALNWASYDGLASGGATHHGLLTTGAGE